MAGREGHEGNVLHVPGAYNHPPAVRVFFYHFNHLSYLIHSLALVIMMHVFILGTRVPPLESVHRPKVSLLSVLKIVLVQKLSAPVPIPDMHAFAG